MSPTYSLPYYYLYFNNLSDAQALGKRLEAEHFRWETEDGVDPGTHLLLVYTTEEVTHPDADDIERMEEWLTELAQEHNGEYDGWEKKLLLP